MNEMIAPFNLLCFDFLLGPSFQKPRFQKPRSKKTCRGPFASPDDSNSLQTRMSDFFDSHMRNLPSFWFIRKGPAQFGRYVVSIRRLASNSLKLRLQDS